MYTGECPRVGGRTSVDRVEGVRLQQRATGRGATILTHAGRRRTRAGARCMHVHTHARTHARSARFTRTHLLLRLQCGVVQNMLVGAADDHQLQLPHLNFLLHGAGVNVDQRFLQLHALLEPLHDLRTHTLELLALPGVDALRQRVTATTTTATATATATVAAPTTLWRGGRACDVQVTLQALDFALQAGDQREVLRDVVRHVEHVARGLRLDFLGPVGVLERVQRFLETGRRWRDVRNHNRPAVATQRVF